MSASSNSETRASEIRETLSLAERLFAGDSARNDIEDMLDVAEVTYERIGWDGYDCSLEVYGVPSDERLPEVLVLGLLGAGFLKIYVNHEDKWETHHSATNLKGWRVSYPHKRGA